MSDVSFKKILQAYLFSDKILPKNVVQNKIYLSLI